MEEESIREAGLTDVSFDWKPFILTIDLKFDENNRYYFTT